MPQVVTSSRCHTDGAIVPLSHSVRAPDPPRGKAKAAAKKGGKSKGSAGGAPKLAGAGAAAQQPAHATVVDARGSDEEDAAAEVLASLRGREQPAAPRRSEIARKSASDPFKPAAAAARSAGQGGRSGTAAAIAEEPPPQPPAVEPCGATRPPTPASVWEEPQDGGSRRDDICYDEEGWEIMPDAILSDSLAAAVAPPTAAAAGGSSSGDGASVPAAAAEWGLQQESRFSGLPGQRRAQPPPTPDREQTHQLSPLLTPPSAADGDARIAGGMPASPLEPLGGIVGSVAPPMFAQSQQLMPTWLLQLPPPQLQLQEQEQQQEQQPTSIWQWPQAEPLQMHRPPSPPPQQPPALPLFLQIPSGPSAQVRGQQLEQQSTAPSRVAESSEFVWGLPAPSAPSSAHGSSAPPRPALPPWPPSLSGMVERNGLEVRAEAAAVIADMSPTLR